MAEILGSLTVPAAPPPAKRRKPRLETVPLAAEEAPESRGLRVAFVALVVALVLSDRFAITISSLPLGASLPLTYLLITVLLTNHRLAIDPAAVLFYVVATTIAVLSFVLNTNAFGGSPASIASMGLLLVIYLPLIFTLKSEPANLPQWRWMMRVLSNTLLVSAAAGILQFYAQFIIHDPWLFNASLLIPEPIRGQGLYNSAIPMGSFFKSNGFFTREPSGFSYLMAFGLLLELSLFKRPRRMVCFVFALALSYSGTGILILAIGLLLPLRVKTMLTLMIGGAVVIIGNAAAGDPLNLGMTYARVGEFSTRGSSAYIRYVAPMLMIDMNIDVTPWSMWVGHGPGMIFKLPGPTEFHDPTWAKLVVEYGMLGFMSFVGLMLYKLSSFPAPFQIRAVLFASWLVTGGQLLAPENVYFMFLVMGLWPRQIPEIARFPRPVEPPSTTKPMPNNLEQNPHTA
ncbi:MAG: hypothetical protein JWP29_1392 [Rhodoferax sp.]|nr:hypothetical protein [Rhodoferax sp.]